VKVFNSMMVKFYTKAKSYIKDNKEKKDPLEIKNKKDSLGKKLVKKAFSKPKVKLQRKKTLMERTFEQIDEMLKGYKKFLEKDFIMLLHEANSLLSEWRNNILNKVGNKSANTLEEAAKISQDMVEISQIYSKSEIALNQMVVKCTEYQGLVKGKKGLVDPQHKINTLNIQLENVIKTLRQGLEMTNIERNSDYKYLSQYIKSMGVEQSLGRSK
jgi:hypothetical protein